MEKDEAYWEGLRNLVKRAIDGGATKIIFPTDPTGAFTDLKKVVKDMQEKEHDTT